MITSSFTFTDPTGYRLFARKWMPNEDNPTAIVQIIHGLGEHCKRYERFAECLTDHGFGVVSYDHRGHGETDPDQLGYIPDVNGFHQMVENIHDFTIRVKQEFPNQPRILFAHSMGSFLTQRYMQLFDDQPAGIIYSGSNGKPSRLLPFGSLISSAIWRLKGADYKSSFIHNLTFKAFNTKFKPNQTDADWLSRDENEVDAYVNDPLCGFTSSVSFYKHFFEGLKSLHNHTPFADHNLSIPILVVSGDKDPVSNMGKGIQNLEQILKSNGVSDLTVKLYDGARHELLNEINRDEVMQDLKTWIDRILN
ncbi:MAG: lysophospholipase [Balneolaceae bacterium]